jgi:hypothetical protein
MCRAHTPNRISWAGNWRGDGLSSTRGWLFSILDTQQRCSRDLNLFSSAARDAPIPRKQKRKSCRVAQANATSPGMWGGRGGVQVNHLHCSLSLPISSSLLLARISSLLSTADEMASSSVTFRACWRAPCRPQSPPHTFSQPARRAPVSTREGQRQKADNPHARAGHRLGMRCKGEASSSRRGGAGANLLCSLGRGKVHVNVQAKLGHVLLAHQPLLHAARQIRLLRCAARGPFSGGFALLPTCVARNGGCQFLAGNCTLAYLSLVCRLGCGPSPRIAACTTGEAGRAPYRRVLAGGVIAVVVLHALEVPEGKCIARQSSAASKQTGCGGDFPLCAASSQK